MHIIPPTCEQKTTIHVRDTRMRSGEFIHVTVTCWLHVECVSELTMYVFCPPMVRVKRSQLGECQYELYTVVSREWGDGSIMMLRM